MRRINQNMVLGALVVALALFALVVWVPNDTVSGFVQSKRGRVTIGDAMAPGLAFGLMLLSGLILLLEARKKDMEGALGARNFAFLTLAIPTCIAAFIVMAWAGPLAVAIFSGEGDTYRNLRDTAPWKYLGFVLGGTGLVMTLISLVEKTVTLKAVLIGLLATLVLIGVFDLAFDNLLLPPNGDQ
ncbi:hypothetical protein [Maritimibacter sp.]|uniref:hypothetical protein n=1 Tax=Maritimibacter sp. TaxID=2003363 RepID=UPI00257A5114|nr:hypothetical protein [Maritimibacter sp.]